MWSPVGEGSYCKRFGWTGIFFSFFSRLVWRSLQGCFSQMLLREADYLHPRLPGIKPISIIVPYHTGLAGKESMYFFSVIPSTDKLVKRMCGIVRSMWVNMPEEEAVGWNSIFIHLMKGLPSLFQPRAAKTVNVFLPVPFCCSVFHIVDDTGNQKMAPWDIIPCLHLSPGSDVSF